MNIRQVGESRGGPRDPIAPWFDKARDLEAVLTELLEARNAHVASLNDYKTLREQFIKTRNRLSAAWDDAALMLNLPLPVNRKEIE